MTPHDILMNLFKTRRKYQTIKSKTLRLHGTRESDRIRRDAMALELVMAERDMREAEQIAALYVDSREETKK